MARYSAPYLLHTPTSYILYTLSYYYLYSYYILCWLRIFCPSPLRAYSILCTRTSILLHLAEILHLVSATLCPTISCQPLHLAPSAFDARSMHNRRPATAQRTAPSTVCNLLRPARFALSRSFGSICNSTLADPYSPHLVHLGISCIQTGTSTTISCAAPPHLTSVQLAQPTILW